MTTPAAVGTGATVDPRTLVDHSWLVLDGVLFCVAGSTHTASAVAGCAYWIRDDIAHHLTTTLRLTRPSLPAVKPLTYRGDGYFKLPALADPTGWPTVHSALSTYGIAALPASLLATCDPGRALDIIEPRAAVRAAAALPVHEHDCGRRVLHELLAALGDPHAAAGLIGLTGSTALDPERYCGGADLDLLIYPALEEGALAEALGRLGGEYLANLMPTDGRRAAYGASRFLLASPAAGRRQDRLWSRRRDVAWVGGVRLDLTPVPATGRLVDQLPYAAPELRPIALSLTLTAVDRGYPAHLTGRTSAGDDLAVWVTARGYDSVCRPGDRVRLVGRLRQPTDGDPLVTVDDHPGHHLRLEGPA